MFARRERLKTQSKFRNIDGALPNEYRRDGNVRRRRSRTRTRFSAVSVEWFGPRIRH